MNWVYLIIAGILEVFWVISLKYTEGFTKLWPTVIYGVLGIVTAYCFSLSLKTIPMGLAYSIWMGIAVVGTAIAEGFMDNKTFGLGRIFFTSLIILGIIGLKIIDKP